MSTCHRTHPSLRFAQAWAFNFFHPLLSLSPLRFCGENVFLSLSCDYNLPRMFITKNPARSQLELLAAIDSGHGDGTCPVIRDHDRHDTGFSANS